MKYLIGLILLFIISCSRAPVSRTDKLSILQGVTNTKEVEFSVVAKKGLPLRFELRSEQGEVIAPDEIKTVSRASSDYVVHKMVFVREAQKDYNLYAFSGEKILDQRLVGRGQREESRLRLAVASCMSDFFEENFSIWDAMAAKNPEYVLLIGDNVYVDYTSKTAKHAVTPEILWNRYVDARLRYPLFFQQKLMPVHAVWDDHDFGENDSDSRFRYKTDSKEIFEAFYAQDLSDDDWNKGFGVGGLLSLGDFNLYFLDARFFRSPDKTGSHLGLDQNAWFYSKLRDEQTPSFVIKGDQFFGGYHAYDSFEGRHPDNFQQFISELRDIKTPFIFLSGDRHMSEIMQFPRSLFGKPSFEITSGPLHARTFDKSDEPNPWRVVREKEHVNFTLIDSTAKDNHWFLDVESVGQNGQLFYRRELAVYIKDLQDNLKEVRKKRSGRRSYRRRRRGRR